MYSYSSSTYDKNVTFINKLSSNCFYLNIQSESSGLFSLNGCKVAAWRLWCLTQTPDHGLHLTTLFPSHTHTPDGLIEQDTVADECAEDILLRVRCCREREKFIKGKRQQKGNDKQRKLFCRLRILVQGKECSVFLRRLKPSYERRPIEPRCQSGIEMRRTTAGQILTVCLY